MKEIILKFILMGSIFITISYVTVLCIIYIDKDYLYFISYYGVNEENIEVTGCCSIDIDKKIKNYNDIKKIILFLKKEYKLKDAIINNYKYIRRV